MVVVDRLNKEAHFILLKHQISTRLVAERFTKEIIRLHGIPKFITSEPILERNFSASTNPASNEFGLSSGNGWPDRGSQPLLRSLFEMFRVGTTQDMDRLDCVGRILV